jgi:REP element-mobilizing transposase RayT
VYHVTQRGTNRERVFLTVADYRLFLELLRAELANAHVEELAYCLTSNHAHLVVVGTAGLAGRRCQRQAKGRLSHKPHSVSMQKCPESIVAPLA